MKKILRFEEDDLRRLVAAKVGASLDHVIAINSEECVGYGQGEVTQPVFYIEVELQSKEHSDE